MIFRTGNACDKLHDLSISHPHDCGRFDHPPSIGKSSPGIMAPSWPQKLGWRIPRLQTQRKMLDDSTAQLKYDQKFIHPYPSIDSHWPIKYSRYFQVISTIASFRTGKFGVKNLLQKSSHLDSPRCIPRGQSLSFSRDIRPAEQSVSSGTYESQ